MSRRRKETPETIRRRRAAAGRLPDRPITPGKPAPPDAEFEKEKAWAEKSRKGADRKARALQKREGQKKATKRSKAQRVNEAQKREERRKKREERSTA